MAVKDVFVLDEGRKDYEKTRYGLPYAAHPADYIAAGRAADRTEPLQHTLEQTLLYGANLSVQRTQKYAQTDCLGGHAASGVCAGAGQTGGVGTGGPAGLYPNRRNIEYIKNILRKTEIFQNLSRKKGKM